MVEQSPRVVEQNIAQHTGIPGGQRMVDSLARETLRHPAFGGGAVNVRQLCGQFPLATLAQEAAKQRMVAKPFAGIVHARQEQTLTFNLFELKLPVFNAGDAHNQRIVHGTQQGAFQQEMAGGEVNAVEYLIHQIIRQVAGVDARQAACGLMRRAVVLPRGEGNQLKRRGPAGNVIAQAAAFRRLNRRRQAAVKELLRFLMGKGQLLTADFQQLIAHAQVGNAQLRKVTRQDNQRQVFRLMAQEETHGLVNNRVGDQMIIINHHIQRAMPFGQLDKQLGEKRGQAGVLALLHHHLAGDAVSVGCLLNRGN